MQMSKPTKYDINFSQSSDQHSYMTGITFGCESKSEVSNTWQCHNNQTDLSTLKNILPHLPDQAADIENQNKIPLSQDDLDLISGNEEATVALKNLKDKNLVKLPAKK